MKTTGRPFLISLSATTLVVLGMFGLASPRLQAATTLPPDSGAVIAPPLNTGPNTQQKVGSLLIGTQTTPSKLCLNATSLSDTTNCITSWAQFSSAAGSFVRLNTTTYTTERSVSNNAYEPSSYQPQELGYADLVARPAQNQAYTTIVKASPVQFCDHGDESIPEGRCINDGVGNACYTNQDCNGNAAAIYATTAGNVNGYAGYFNGRVFVTPSADGVLGRICLGDPTTEGACITSWNQLAAIPAYVARYTDGVWRNTRQGGGASISGNAIFGTAILGDPTGLPVVYTCGDGACQPTENTTSCPVDCNSVSQPTVTASMASAATPASLQVSFNVTIGVQQPSSVRLYVVRAQNQAPVWRPIDGVTYANGLVVGPDRIVQVVNTSSGAVVNVSDTLPSAGTYYYQFYQANNYPRYSNPITPVEVTPYALTLVQSPDYTAINVRSGPQYAVWDSKINCGFGPATCTKMYLKNQVVVLWRNSALSGKYISGWNGCSGGGQTRCTATMTSDLSVTMYWATSGGGGGIGCFIAGTAVDTPFGPRSIERLRVGDAVYAYDLEHQRRVVSHVRRTFVHRGLSYGQVGFSDGTILHVTAVHPFYNAGTRQWQEIGEMRPGDAVLKQTGPSSGTVTITTMNFAGDTADVYNLEVDGYHNYFVEGILVHNKFGGGSGSGG